MSDISPVANGISAVDISAASAASAASPDPAFSRIMEDALLADEAPLAAAPAGATGHRRLQRPQPPERPVSPAR